MTKYVYGTIAPITFGLLLSFETSALTWESPSAASDSTSIRIMLVKGSTAQVSGLEDIRFDNTQLNDTVSIDSSIEPLGRSTGSDFCVFRSLPSRNYAIALNSLNGSEDGNYDLLNANNGDRVSYSVNWDDDNDASDGLAIKEGGAAAGSFASEAHDPTCANGSNAAIELNFNKTGKSNDDLLGFRDVLTITVAPL